MSKNETHNGYTNYETWCVISWIDNTKEYYDMFHNYINNLPEAYDIDSKRSVVMYKLKEFVRIMAPKSENFWSGIITDVLAERINYYEIANALLDT